MAWGARRGIDDVLLRLGNNDPKLQSLYLLGSRIFGEKEALALCAALKGNTVLKELHISSHAVTPAMAAAFADLLACSSTLSALSLGNRSFGNEGIQALCPGIGASSSLQLLDLEAKGLTAAGCPALAEALAASSSLREVVLAQNDLGHEGIAALASGLLGLRVLDLRSTGLEDAGAWEAVAQVLRGGRLEVLRCEGNRLGAEGATALAPALGTCASLRQLHMAGCSLGEDGVRALASNLPPGLQVLDWSDCGLGVGGAEALATALAGCADEAAHPPTALVRQLVLCNNGITDVAVAQLAEALSGGPTGGSVGDGGDSLEQAPGLALDLGGNAVGKAALRALAGCGPRLSALRLHACGLGASGAAELARLLGAGAGFGGLRELDVSACGVPAEGLLALLGTLRDCPGACPALRLLVVAANEGLEGEGVIEAAEGLQEARPGLTVVRRAADAGELRGGGRQ